MLFSVGVVFCRRGQETQARGADGPGSAAGISVAMSMGVSLSLSRRMPTAMRAFVDVHFSIRAKLARHESCAQEIQSFLREALLGDTSSNDAGPCACLFVYAETSLNQRLIANDRAPHVCHCEANVDSSRVLFIAQFQKQIFSSTTHEGLTVRGSLVAQPGIPLQGLDRSLRSEPRRTKRD